MNSKVKSIILKSVTIFSCMFALISLAFGTIASSESFVDGTLSFGDWTQLVDLSKYEVWQASEAFIIISIVILSLIVIGVVLQFFITNKILNLVIKILSIVGLLTVLMGFVLLLVGCIENSSSLSNIIPAVGQWLFVIFGILGSGLGIACGKKVKTSKRKK